MREEVGPIKGPREISDLSDLQGNLLWFAACP